MEWLCAGAAIWVVLAIVGLLALAGLVIVLVKLGVIVHYAAKPEAPDVAGDYDLGESREVGEEGAGSGHE